MERFCHRCQAELPQRLPGAEVLLFCPHCSAPQILLPEHMRVGTETAPAGEAVEPPQPPAQQGIDWQSVLPTAAWVAGVGGLLSVLSLKSAFAGFLSPLWVMVSGSIVLAVYLRRRPGARMSGMAGWRIGLVTGLLMVGAKGVGLSAAGVVARFGTHSMAGYDADHARSLQAQQALMASMFPAQSKDPQFIAKQQQLEAPEWQAGFLLTSVGFGGLIVMLFAGLGGLFSGAIEKRRRVVAGQG